MEVRITDMVESGGPYVVEVAGDIDIATVPELEDPVIGAIDSGLRPVILDLGECGFIDSSGIRLLVRAHHLLRGDSGNGHLMAIVARGQVARLLDLTSVDKAIPVVGSRAEAESVLDLPAPA